MMRTPRSFLAGAGLALALTVAGCGGSNSNTATNSAPAGGGKAGDPAYRFAACMRGHGVANFPDPVEHPDGSGGVSVSMRVDPSITGQQSFPAAQRACKGILPGPGSNSPEDLANKPRFLAFAVCMRSRGIGRFPDPQPDGRLTIPMIQAAGVDLAAANFATAARACASVTHGLITPAEVGQLVRHVKAGATPAAG